MQCCQLQFNQNLYNHSIRTMPLKSNIKVANIAKTNFVALIVSFSPILTVTLIA